MARPRQRAGRGPGRQTFPSAAEAARVFFTGNELYLDHIPDPIDGLRAWADGIDVVVGRGGSTRRLAKSAAGRKILEARQGEPQIRAALQWVFQQAAGRRWDTVDWSAIDDLGRALEPHYEPPDRGPATAGLYWRPMVGAGKPVAERLDELDPHDAVALGRLESETNLAEAVAELRETYADTKGCLPAGLRTLVERRISEWSAWVDDPAAIPAYACEPDEASQGYVCNYPLVTGELRELRGACRHAYDPDWFADDSDRDEPGFPPAPGDPRGRAPEPDEGEAAGERLELGPLPEAPAELATAACPSEDLRQLQTDGRAYGGPARLVAETRSVGEVFYQSEWRERSGKRHGPYWYGYWRDETGRRRSAYIGREFRELREL